MEIIKTVWGQVKLISMNLDKLCINGFIIPLDKTKEYIEEVPVPNEGVMRRIIGKILEEKDFIEREEAEFDIDCGKEIKAFWKIHFEVVKYYGPQRCDGFREIGQKIGKENRMDWTNGSFEIMYPRLPLKEELEYLMKNELFFMDINGDSVMDDSYSSYFYERIKQISNKLKIPNPKWRPKLKRRDLKLVKLKFTCTHRNIPFKIENAMVWIKVGKKKVRILIPAYLSTVSENLSVNIKVLGCCLEGIYRED
ncbi:hypothetical protein D4R86_01605 [bacterium]|nr:MAG: hypothetical protein D4R86_01605 [bacterium]